MYRILVVFFVFISFRVFSISFDYDDLGRLSYSKDDYYVYDANNNLLTIGKDISGNVDDISFVELYPINGSYKNYLSITFKWENEELNNSFIYDLYISEDENPTLYKSNNELSYLTASFEDEVKPLYWRVVARNIQGSSKSSQIFKIFPLDEDMDEIPDHIEASMCTSSNKSDTDGDNLSDNNEIQLGTNPCNSDTDSDGIPDGIEYQIGSDPLHQDSGTIVDNFNESYWESYVIDVEKQANLQGIKEESGSALLDVSDHDGYAISGIAPEGSEFSMMYWVKTDAIPLQLSDSSDSSTYGRSYLGVNRYGREYMHYGGGYSKSSSEPKPITVGYNENTGNNWAVFNTGFGYGLGGSFNPNDNGLDKCGCYFGARAQWSAMVNGIGIGGKTESDGLYVNPNYESNLFDIDLMTDVNNGFDISGSSGIFIGKVY